MKVKVSKSSVAGKVKAPPSKSYTQRALACALLAEGGASEIINPSLSDDGLSAVHAARMLGARVVEGEGCWRVAGGVVATPDDVVDCGGSATAFRFFTALSAHAQGATVLTGDASLRRRPMGELLSAMNALGARCFSTRGNGLPPVVVLGGGIAGGEAVVRGDVSSQFVSSLIISCARGGGDTTLLIDGELESKHYVAMTLEVLRRFGGSCIADSGMRSFRVPSRQPLRPCRYDVEGDYSSAAFMLAAGILAGEVEVFGIRTPSIQGDSQIIEILRRMGGDISTLEGRARSARSGLRGADIDARHVPDLVPIVVALASRAEGDTIIRGVKRLRYKESNRIDALVQALGRMGARIRAEEDAIVISGKSSTKGSEVDPMGDHRIAMTCSVLALVSDGETVINDAECVSKSYPSFYDDLRSIGAVVEVVP